MDDGQNGRYMDYYKAAHPAQYQGKEQTNALVMNKKIMAILAEKDAAIQERNLAVAEKREAIKARDEAIQQREKALAERDKALMERDNALAAIQYRDNAMNFSFGRGSKRTLQQNWSYCLIEKSRFFTLIMFLLRSPFFSFLLAFWFYSPYKNGIVIICRVQREFCSFPCQSAYLVG
ncbi:unnamed protein product [Linum trigynum]|uniref:GAGA-binding transcriptional activator n=1 Tax=Linum trigynum TaxID=586398 RepID=A0AAV2C7J5_9ROSI